MDKWKSPEELQKDEAAFLKIMHVLLGLYAWEVVTSLDFEIDLIKGKKRFRWPLIFYFSGRYFLLFALIGIVISLNITIKINCQVLYIFNQVCGNMAIGLASVNLSFRTIAVWSRSIYVVIPIVFLILGHWSLLLHGLLIKAAWNPTEGGCVITNTNNILLAATFIYSMAFDGFVLILTGYKLAYTIGLGGINTRSTLVKMIFVDGLIFFIVAFLANLIATIFMLMDLNAVMSIIFNVPAAIASTIVASRAVRRLTNLTSKGHDVYPTGQNSTLRFSVFLSQSMRGMNNRDIVHMETFALEENTAGLQSSLERHGRGRTKDKTVVSYDVEAQDTGDYQ